MLATEKYAFRLLQDLERTAIIGNKYSKILITYLGYFGPQSIPSVQKNFKACCKALRLQNPDSDFDMRLEYVQIEREIEPLATKGLIEELHFFFHKKSTKIMGLTFEGIVLYFKEPPPLTERKLDHFFKSYQAPYIGKSRHRKNLYLLENYRQIIPFCPLWEKMVKQIGNKCLSRLSETVTGFYVGEKTLRKIAPLNIEVETFPNYSGECTDRIFNFERDNKVADYLKKEEAILLREAYIAYLINEDLNLLSHMDVDKVRQKLLTLKSVEEYAFFEETSELGTSLFTKEGLSKFFPKYSGIEYYFTGMFVNNLLWDKKST